jgi:hypothetical protein
VVWGGESVLDFFIYATTQIQEREREREKRWDTTEGLASDIPTREAVIVVIFIAIVIVTFAIARAAKIRGASGRPVFVIIDVRLIVGETYDRPKRRAAQQRFGEIKEPFGALRRPEIAEASFVDLPPSHAIGGRPLASRFDVAHKLPMRLQGFLGERTTFAAGQCMRANAEALSQRIETTVQAIAGCGNHRLANLFFFFFFEEEGVAKRCWRSFL